MQLPASCFKSLLFSTVTPSMALKTGSVKRKEIVRRSDGVSPVHTGLSGLQWQVWINGELGGFFLHVRVWCGSTLMQNMVVAAPLRNGTFHFEMDAIADTSLVRVEYMCPVKAPTGIVCAMNSVGRCSFRRGYSRS